MKLRIAAAVAALCLAGAGEARADDWRFVSASRDSLWALDASTIQRSGPRVLFWGLNLHRVTQAEGLDYIMIQGAIDCDARTLGLQATLEYNAAHVMFRSSPPNGATIPITPSSIGGYLYDIVCLNRWTDSGPGHRTVSELVAWARPAMEQMPVN